MAPARQKFFGDTGFKSLRSGRPLIQAGKVLHFGLSEASAKIVAYNRLTNNPNDAAGALMEATACSAMPSSPLRLC